MIYALSDNKGKWVIMLGWEGCTVGQGNILELDVDERDIEIKITYHRRTLKLHTGP